MPSKKIKENEIQNHNHNDVIVSLEGSGYKTKIRAGNHRFIADEPKDIGGDDFGPSPYALLNASLGACTAMTLHMYARRKKWDLKSVKVHLVHQKDYIKDCEDCDKPGAKLDHFERKIEITGELDESQRQRLLEIANRCPVHKTLKSPDVKISTSLLS